MSNVVMSRRYLKSVMAEDESLAEHDAKYHKDGFKEGDTCEKRGEMESVDPADTDIRKDDSAVAVGHADREKAKKAWSDRWKKYLNMVDIENLSKLLHAYDDDKHPDLMKLIMDEVGRRENGGLEKMMKDLGERA